MTLTIKPKHIVIVVIIAAISISIYFFRHTISDLFVNGSQKTVDRALKYLKDQKSVDINQAASLFTIDYELNLLSHYSYYKVDEWKLSSKKNDDGTYTVSVDGITTNGFGAKLERRPDFIVEKRDKNWVIKDSYGLFAFDKLKENYVSGKSDMEKHRILDDLKTKVKIEHWSFSSPYENTIEGKGIIVNNSDIPINFVKLLITYENGSGTIVNTDETYAIGSDELLPGQRRTFDWYTSNCYSCQVASIKLKFED